MASSSSSVKAVSVQDHLREADQALHGPDPQSAIIPLQSALQLEPDNHEILKALARVCSETGQGDQARDYCRRVLLENPSDAEGLALLSNCQFDLEEFSAELPELPCLGPLRLVKDDSAPVTPQSGADPKLGGLLGDYAERCLAWSKLGPEHLLQELVCGLGDDPVVLKSREPAKTVGADGFPVPPVSLTMGYGAGDLDHYLDCGVRSHQILTSLLKSQNIVLESGDHLLDWGCAAGRVVRAFHEETVRGARIWGCDVDAPAIAWAQDHLSPPFRFLNGTALPHLPFSDGTFRAIYGLSVFTHLVVFRDMWLLELARLLAPGGCAILTIHDEHCWSHFHEQGMPHWMPDSLRHHENLPAECVEIRGSRWDGCYTFFHSDYIRRVWGQYLNVVDIVPQADSYQAAVVLRKPEAQK